MAYSTPLTFEQIRTLSEFMRATDETNPMVAMTVPPEFVTALRAAVEVAMEDYDNRVLADHYAEELAAE
jgi:hypothetical protein